MAKITSVKTSADNNKLFTAQVNDDNTREFKEYDITSGINNKSLSNTADVTSFDEGMDVITVNPTGDKFVGVDRRGRDVVNLSTTNNFSVNSFNLLGSYSTNPNRDFIFDLSFNLNINNHIRTITPVNDNKFLISGYFTSVGGHAYNRLARLNSDGTVDTSFIGSSFNDDILGVEFVDGKIYVAGEFSTVNGSSTYRSFCRLNEDGTIDNTWQTLNIPNRMFYVKKERDGFIYVGGANSSFNDGGRMFRLTNDGQFDSTFGYVYSTLTNRNSYIWPIHVSMDNKIYVGGYFTSFSGITRRGLVRLNNDGTVDTSFTMNTINDTVVSSIYQPSNGYIYVSGYFTQVNGINRSRFFRLLPNGDLDINYELNFNNVVSNIYDLGDGLMVSGHFTTVNGLNSNRMVRISYDGEILQRFDIPFNNYVFPSIKINNSLYVGGLFTSPRTYLAKLNK